MDSPPPAISVHHIPSAHRYEAHVDGQLAVAEYELAANQMIFTHTFVPPALRGRGIAEKLVRAGLADAQRQGLAVVAQCSYVARFLERHPELNG